MFVGSFISGLIPLTLTLSESKMRFITIIGAGLLVGTALAVIIPEGVHTLYKNNGNVNEHGHDVNRRGISSTLQANVIKRHSGHDHDHVHNHDDQNLLLDKLNKEKELKANEELHGGHSEGSHSAIGVTLVLGFVFMLIVDQIGGQIGHMTSK